LNHINHGVSFKPAKRIFGDPMLPSRRDPYPAEECRQSIGGPSSASLLTLFVVGTVGGYGRGRADHLGQTGH